MKTEKAKQIGWVDISKRKYGGGKAYADRVEHILSRDSDVAKIVIDVHILFWKYLKPIEWFFRFLLLRGKKDLWISHSFETLIGLTFSRLEGKKIAVVHHIDNSAHPTILRPLFIVLEWIYYHNLRKMDAVVTVSTYWENHLRDRQYDNVYKIYNTVPLEKFSISEEEVEAFKKRHRLEGKPILYIGNCQRAKGVVESYEALKHLDVHLITSGERHVALSAKNLDVPYEEYLLLLKASTLVIAMSKFQEGWCVTAQEAMAFGVPVIGSGRGGMRELLEDGGQIVCEDFSSLAEKAEYFLAHEEARKVMGEQGFQFVKQFTPARFEKEWRDLVQAVITP